MNPVLRLLPSSSLPFLAAAFVAACPLVPAHAADGGTPPSPGPSWSLAGFTRVDFGASRYEFSSPAWLDEERTVLGRIASRLDFPLDAVMAGARLGVTGALPSQRPWGLTAEIAANATDPRGVMYDHDWITWPGRFDGKFSYTESDAEMKALEIGVGAWLGLGRRGPWTLRAMGGYRRLHFDQDVKGIRGWQFDSEFERHDFVIPDILALTYEITYGIANAGLELRRDSPSGRWLRLAASPGVAWMDDVDDHVLRFKESTASGTGFALLADLEAGIPLARRGAGARTPGVPARSHPLSLVLTASGEYASIAAQQTQRWYGDDPASSGDDTGDVATGIPHDVTLTRASVGLRLVAGL